MTRDPSTAGAPAPEAPPTGDSLRLVRLRLYLTIAAAAVLPLALGSPLIRVLTGGSKGLEPVHVAALALVCALLVVLTRWMTHQILRPAAELEASRARQQVLAFFGWQHLEGVGLDEHPAALGALAALAAAGAGVTLDDAGAVDDPIEALAAEAERLEHGVVLQCLAGRLGTLFEHDRGQVMRQVHDPLCAETRVPLASNA